MFALVSAAGTNRERVPDTQGLPKPCISPWAGTPGAGANRGWRWLHTFGSCGWFSKNLLGWEMARGWLGDISSCCNTCFHTSSSPLSWLGAALLPWGTTWLHPQGSHPTPSSQGLPRPLRTSPEERNKGREGTGEGSAPVRAAAPSLSC